MHTAVKTNADVILIKSTLRFSNYSALVVVSEIANVEYSHKLCAYAGVVSSVRNSADVTHHGKITKRGSTTLKWVMTKCIHSHTIHTPNRDIIKDTENHILGRREFV